VDKEKDYLLILDEIYAAQKNGHGELVVIEPYEQHGRWYARCKKCLAGTIVRGIKGDSTYRGRSRFRTPCGSKVPGVILFDPTPTVEE
jgi:hypothetical protein